MTDFTCVTPLFPKVNCGFDSPFGCLIVNCIMIIEDTTPLGDITAANFKTLLKDYLREHNNATFPPGVREDNWPEWRRVSTKRCEEKNSIIFAGIW